MRNLDYVFGYGSLVDVKRLKVFLGRDTFAPHDLLFCRLNDYRRSWNVAMDNRLDIPGYKYYLDPQTNLRPEIYVTFLNVRINPGDSITGLLFRVWPDELKLLDQRERNYSRIDVADKLDQFVAGRVWLYVGSPEAEERFQAGRRNGTGVISRQYYELVYHAFHSLGETFAAGYLATTDKPEVPLRDLKPMSL